MKKFISVSTLLFLISGCINHPTIYQPETEMFPVPSFKKMEETVKSFKEAGIAQTLIVMDDDDTLTR